MGSNKQKRDSTASSNKEKPIWRSLDPQGLYERAGAWLLILGEQLAWYAHIEYTGHTLKRREKDWFLIVRGRRQGTAMVSFSAGDTPTECVRHMAYDMRNGRTRWKPDKFG